MTDSMDRAQQVADQLRDTTKNIIDVATEAELDSAEFCDALDSLVFECVNCGWWCDSADRADCLEDKCLDCAEIE